MSMRTPERRYDPRELDAKWQERWDRDKLYQVRDDDPRPKWYELTMYPYPSGDLHIGHWYAMTPADAHARFRRMQGYNVLHPMGFDAFGLPAENAAIRRGIHPYQWTMSNIENMRRQLSSMGSTYDWDREIICALPEYYRWNQWIFLQFYKAGLAYRANAPANWCPSCQTVLANEQVVDGKCERCDSAVSRRDLEQWFFGITKYAEELLDFSGLLDWPERIKAMQTNWIGRSVGVEISFDISEYGLEETEIRTFTTRIDTIYGVTFVVIAPEHPLVDKLTTPDRRAEVDAYVEQARRQSEVERLSTEREKSGVFTGSYAINRLNGDRVPIFVADYVLLTYGTGIVMGVPAHDQRDFDFAKKYGLDIRVVIAPAGWEGGELEQAHVEGRDAGELRSIRRPASVRRQGAHRRPHRGQRLGSSHRLLQAAGLAHLPPAVLGHSHTHAVLRQLRRGSRAGRGTAGASAGGRPVPAHRRVSPEIPRAVPERCLPLLRRARPEGDGHDGHLCGLFLVSPALRQP